MKCDNVVNSGQFYQKELGIITGLILFHLDCGGQRFTLSFSLNLPIEKLIHSFKILEFGFFIYYFQDIIFQLN